MIIKMIQDISFVLIRLDGQVKVCVGPKLLTIGYAPTMEEAEEIIRYFLQCPISLPSLKAYILKQEQMLYNK
jgi:hypothetical protein